MYDISGMALIPMIVGIVEILKRTGVPKRLLPLSSLILGIGSGVFFLYPTDLKMGIFTGIILGLSASGLYSGTKNTIENNHPKNQQ